jgi:hypothetical protein
MKRGALGAIARRHSLGVACVLAPLILTFIIQGVFAQLVPKEQVATVSLSYTFRDAVTPSPAGGQGRTSEGAASPAASEPAARSTEAAARLQLWALYLAGRYNVVIGSSFIFLAAAFAISFACWVLYMRGGPLVLTAAIIASIALGSAMAKAAQDSKFALVLVLDRILDAADRHPELKQLKAAGSSAETVNSVILLNTFLGYCASLLIVIALYLLSLRATPTELNLEALKSRRDSIRFALILLSALLVVSVISTKISLQWPLSLIVDAEKAALTGLADAITFRWGTLSTVMLAAAFAPAIAAWSLDVKEFRSKSSASKKAETGGGHDDGLDFAVVPALGGVLAVLGPILASPFLDALKALLAVIPVK